MQYKLFDRIQCVSYYSKENIEKFVMHSLNDIYIYSHTLAPKNF